MRRESLAVLSVSLYLCSIPAWAQSPINACDLATPYGTIDQNDIAAATGMAINPTTCTANSFGWIYGTSVCNAVVVQRVVNASLGQGCVVGTHSVVLTWSASTPGTYPIQGYLVFRTTPFNPSYQQMNTAPVTALTYTDPVVTNSGTYNYCVKAVDTQNNQSACSTPATAIIPSS